MNRFAMLSMDDDSSDEAGAPVVAPIPSPPPTSIQVPEPPRTESSRKWNLNEGRPEEVREWGLHSNSRGRRHGPFSRYSFKDDKSRHGGPPRKYAFRDDSPPLESRKPVSPINPPVLICDLKDLPPEEFPALSEYERPHTPPYPPDDGFYPTLAERIKIAMEKKEPEPEEKKTINMDTVIPMATRFSKTLVLE